MKQNLNIQRSRRKNRVRAVINGTAKMPRISVHRSNRYIYAQAIDDEKRVTMVYSSSFRVGRKAKKVKKTEDAKMVGKDLGKRLIEKGVKKAVFDRGSFAYLGRVKEVADGLREAGLKI